MSPMPSRKRADQLAVVGRQLLDALLQHPAHAFGQADDADGVVAARLVLVGQEIGLAVAAR